MAAVHLPATPAAKAAAPTATKTNSPNMANLRIVMENSCPSIIPAASRRLAMRRKGNWCLTRGFGSAENLFLDLPVDVAAGELGRHPNRVLDGVGVGRAVPDDAPATHAEQRSAAIFGMVQAFSETAERILGKRVPDLAADGSFQRFPQQFLEHVHQPLAHLERHIAGEAVADDHVHFAGVDIASFHVADEVDVQVDRKSTRLN